MRDALEQSVAMSLGMSLELVQDSASAASREGWRRWVASTAGPWARLVEHEVEHKLGAVIRIDFTELASSDVQGRARSVAALVKAGVPVNDALRLCGFDAKVTMPPPPEGGSS